MMKEVLHINLYQFKMIHIHSFFYI